MIYIIEINTNLLYTCITEQWNVLNCQTTKKFLAQNNVREIGRPKRNPLGLSLPADNHEATGSYFCKMGWHTTLTLEYHQIYLIQRWKTIDGVHSGYYLRITFSVPIRYKMLCFVQPCCVHSNVFVYFNMKLVRLYYSQYLTNQSKLIYEGCTSNFWIVYISTL